MGLLYMGTAGPAMAGAGVCIFSGIRTTNPPKQSNGLRFPFSPTRQSSRLSASSSGAGAVETVMEVGNDFNDEIARLCKVGDLGSAVALLEELAGRGRRVGPKSYCSVLQLCAGLKALRAGEKVHRVLELLGCVEIDGVLGSKLVGMYVECGDLASGRRVFEGIEKDCVFMWNQLMNEYARIGEFAECIGLFEQMIDLGVELNSYCFTTVLKCIAALGSVEGGKQVHGLILRLGLESCIVSNALIACYSKCRMIELARKVFDEMQARDVITYNSMISAYISNGLAKEGIEVLRDMWFSGVAMNLATLVCVLPACAEMFLWQGKVLHGYAVKAGLVEGITLNNSLLNMYVKCGELAAGVQLFVGMNEKNVASWTIIISGYARDGQFDRALDLFYEMDAKGVRPDLFAITSILNACACNGSLDCGKRIHDYIRRNELEKNLYVTNSLMDMYAKCGSMVEAKLIFDKIVEKDIISWNTMIGGYSKKAFPNEAIGLFARMLPFEKPNAVTIASLLPACAGLSVLERGREIHAYVMRNGLFEDIFVANALIDMYVKCGALALACQLFDALAVKDLISWTVMIAGYGMHGRGGEAIAAFNKMREMGFKPDEISFTSILFSCARSSLVDEGRRIFNIMRYEYKIVPKMNHYASMVDLLGRAGRLNDAYKFIQSMPIKPNSSVWAALLKACKYHRNANLAEKVAQRLFDLEPEDAGHYLLLADVYAEVEKWEAVNKIRHRIGLQKLRKNPGFSWIEIKDKVQVFVSGDRSHPQVKKIEVFLWRVKSRMEEEGYDLKMKYTLVDLENRNKEVALCGHSERLAIAFGILNLPSRKPIRVTKNSRICGDCHETAEFISKKTGREIILRDSNWFHHFVNGKCSCRGYW